MAPSAKSMRHRMDELCSIQKSPFDRVTAVVTRFRRELLSVKLKLWPGGTYLMSPIQRTVASASMNGLPQSNLNSPSNLAKMQQFISGSYLPRFMIHDDFRILLVLLYYQDVMFNLSVIFPSHTPNWELVAECVNANNIIQKTPKLCRYHYEAVIAAKDERFEDKNTFPASTTTKQSKSKKKAAAAAAATGSAIASGGVGFASNFVGAPNALNASIGPQPGSSKNTSNKDCLNSYIQPLRRIAETMNAAGLDNNKAFTSMMFTRFQAIKRIVNNKTHTASPLSYKNNPNNKSYNHTQLLKTAYNIDFDQPISASVLAEMKHENEKKTPTKLQAAKNASASSSPGAAMIKPPIQFTMPINISNQQLVQMKTAHTVPTALRHNTLQQQPPLSYQISTGNSSGNTFEEGTSPSIGHNQILLNPSGHAVQFAPNSGQAKILTKISRPGNTGSSGGAEISDQVTGGQLSQSMIMGNQLTSLPRPYVQQLGIFPNNIAQQQAAEISGNTLQHLQQQQQQITMSGAVTMQQQASSSGHFVQTTGVQQQPQPGQTMQVSMQSGPNQQKMFTAINVTNVTGQQQQVNMPQINVAQQHQQPQQSTLQARPSPRGTFVYKQQQQVIQQQQAGSVAGHNIRQIQTIKATNIMQSTSNSSQVPRIQLTPIGGQAVTGNIVKHVVTSNASGNLRQPGITNTQRILATSIGLPSQTIASPGVMAVNKMTPNQQQPQTTQIVTHLIRPPTNLNTSLQGNMSQTQVFLQQPQQQQSGMSQSSGDQTQTIMQQQQQQSQSAMPATYIKGSPNTSRPVVTMINTSISGNTSYPTLAMAPTSLNQSPKIVVSSVAAGGAMQMQGQHRTVQMKRPTMQISNLQTGQKIQSTLGLVSNEMQQQPTSISTSQSISGVQFPFNSTGAKTVNVSGKSFVTSGALKSSGVYMSPQVSTSVAQQQQQSQPAQSSSQSTNVSIIYPEHVMFDHVPLPNSFLTQSQINHDQCHH